MIDVAYRRYLTITQRLVTRPAYSLRGLHLLRITLRKTGWHHFFRVHELQLLIF
jgi:hypothetical protein